MKKFFAVLPMIGLILGAVAIATEINKPMSFDQKIIKPVPACKIFSSSDRHINTSESPLICAQ